MAGDHVERLGDIAGSLIRLEFISRIWAVETKSTKSKNP